MLAYRNPLVVLGTSSSDCKLYNTVIHKHNFRSHDAVCVCVYNLGNNNKNVFLFDLNVAVILTPIYNLTQSCWHGLSIYRENLLYIVTNLFKGVLTTQPI